MPTITQLPPPLSSPPTVESLERLLDGLQRPLRTGVPAPPTAPPVTRGDRDRSPFDASPFDGPLFDDHPARLHVITLPDEAVAAEPATITAPVPPPAAPGPPGGLSWSAHPGGTTRHRHRLLLAVAAAVTTLGAVAAVTDRVL